MRIKHWQGYGTVNAVKKSKRKIETDLYDNFSEIVIEVSGEHEWGLVPQYTDIVFDWLLKRFDKSVTNDSSIYQWNYEYDFSKDVETCIYRIIYEV